MKPIIMPTPNFGYRNEFGAIGGRGIKGRHGHKVKAIVLHVWEGLWTAGTRSWFFSPTRNVSYNDVVLKNGEWIQLVDPFDPAWANGGGKDAVWPGIIKTRSGTVINPNLYTHAISREGFHREITPAQEKSLIYVAKFRAEQHGLPLVRESFIGHRDISPRSRPNCPGRGLNWERFIKEIESPEMVVPPDEELSSFTYIVERGDTFLHIARRFRINAAELARANPHIKNTSRIFPGDKILIPQKVHIVKSGDVFWQIAQKYDIDVPVLIGTNPHIKDPSKIFPGDKIYILKKK